MRGQCWHIFAFINQKWKRDSVIDLARLNHEMIRYNHEMIWYKHVLKNQCSRSNQGCLKCKKWYCSITINNIQEKLFLLYINTLILLEQSKIIVFVSYISCLYRIISCLYRIICDCIVSFRDCIIYFVIVSYISWLFFNSADNQ